MSKLHIPRGYWMENVPIWIISILGESEQSSKELRNEIYDKIREFDPDVGDSAIRQRFDRAIKYLYESGELIEIKHHYKIAEKSSHQKFSELVHFFKSTNNIVDIIFVLDRTTSYIKNNVKVNYYQLLEELKIKILSVPSRKYLYEKKLFDSINNMFFNLLYKYENKLIPLSLECIPIIKIDFLNECKNVIDENFKYLDRFFILFLSYVPYKKNIKYIINLICRMPIELF